MKFYLEELEVEFEEEYRFCERKWRFDFAIPERMIAIEVEGGVMNGGRHTRPIGFLNDCIKYNTATAMGWKVYRFPTSAIMDASAKEFLAKHL